MVTNRFSVLVRFLLPLYPLVFSLSVLAADSEFFSSAQQLQETKPLKAYPVNLYSLANDKQSRAVQYQGKVSLIHFWASWCVPCRNEFPAIEDLQREFKNKNIQVVTIAADNVKAVGRFVKENHVQSLVLIDQYGKAMYDYKVRALPSSYILDKQGVIRFRANGHVNWYGNDTRQKLQELINE